jgi:hypothetical protein
MPFIDRGTLLISHPRVFVAAMVSAVVAFWPGCAGATSLESAAEDCHAGFDGDLRDTDPASCDGYVSAAKQSGDKRELFTAYSIRSLLWQVKGDLKTAMRDADLAIEAEPAEDYGHAWRAVLIGFGGDYRAALAQLAALERNVPQKDFYEDMAMTLGG